MRLIDADTLLEQYGLKDATKYGNESAEQQHKSYSTLMMYEIADMIYDAPTISPAANWTPCSVALPKNTGSFKVTVQVGSEIGSWRETMIIPYRILDGGGEWFPPKSEWKSFSVIAWADADEPYRGEA